MKNIIIAGSINMDIVTKVNKNPQSGESVFGNKISYIPGGKGANQSRAVSRLGGKAKLIAKVGNDQFGKILIDSLKKDDIETQDIKISKNHNSGVAVITVDKFAQNRIIIVSGSNFDLIPKDIASAPIKQNAIAISQFEIPKNTIEAFFKKAKGANCLTILNPSPLGKIDQDLLSLVDFLIINEVEFAQLTKIKKPQITSQNLGKYASKFARSDQTIIVTFAEKGSVAIKDQTVTKVAAFRVKAVDTTGAGDSFLGAFAQAQAEGKNPQESLVFANAAAALKVTKLGASSMPFRKDVEEFLEREKNK